jgi:hypothetical protein
MPELTQEERQKIYEEEKVRAEAKVAAEKEIKKKKPAGCLPVLLIILGIVFVIYLLSPDRKISEAGPETKTSAVVYYHVEGSGTNSAHVTYENRTGGTEQLDSVNLPWDCPLGDVPRGTFLYISAQNNERSGCITTSLIIDGVKTKDTRSCGEFVIATSSGRL